ncbi:preprotein translocase subunit YajC [Phycisphaerales bacterium AB-hyl4]|uniref:Sec translocon accessory complex subunit YajC n=1 Tax=Natronomicrosphaera hydrolytica TaxID=3242702 RepID=A0ABV4U7A3_9BACT
MNYQLFVTLTLAQNDDPAPFTPEMQNQGAQTGEGQPGTAQDPNGGQPTGGTGGGSFDPMFFFLMIGLLVVMMIFFSSSQRREKKRRKTMLEALKKGDRIQSVGGIIGSVVDIREDEIVVKVDENTNTRLRFARNAVQNVLNKDE